MSPLLEIKGLYGGYEKDVNILQGIDLTVAEGDGGDRADQPDLQHVELRAYRQAQPLAKLKKHFRQLADTHMHTHQAKNNSKKDCFIGQKHISLQRLEEPPKWYFDVHTAQNQENQ